MANPLTDVDDPLPSIEGGGVDGPALIDVAVAHLRDARSGQSVYALAGEPVRDVDAENTQLAIAAAAVAQAHALVRIADSLDLLVQRGTR